MRAGSLVFVHLTREGANRPDCPEELVTAEHPEIDERLWKSVMLLEGVSTRTGLGAISSAHGEQDLVATLESFRAGFDRLKRAGLV